MNSFLSHISAACAWDIPYLHVVLGYGSVEEMLSACKQKEVRCSLDPNKRLKVSSGATHYKALQLPAGSVVTHRGELVASPELVFLNLATQLGFHRAVLLGMQLCASDPNGRIPLTSSKKLKRYLAKCEKHHGFKAATQAVRYVTDNSWSVMESLLYMLLTLPNYYGGFNLNGALLNQAIELKEKTSTKRLYADLYWKQAKLIVEYDSYAYHNNADAWMKDARRMTALERKGFTTFSVNTAQIYSDPALTEAAHALAKHLGKRIRIRSPRFQGQKRALRSLLPRSEPASE